MKFLVDAHFPRRLAHWLRTVGHDAIHTSELPLGNGTPDSMVNEISLREKRVVITKDEDFVGSFLLHQQPYKLLLVSTGNIKNAELEQVFQRNIESISEAFEINDFIEIDRNTLTFHS